MSKVSSLTTVHVAGPVSGVWNPGMLQGLSQAEVTSGLPGSPSGCWQSSVPHQGWAAGFPSRWLLGRAYLQFLAPGPLQHSSLLHHSVQAERQQG